MKKIKEGELNMKEIAERVTRRRKELGLSLREMADKLGLKSHNSVYRFETGVFTSANLDTIFSFARVLNTTPNYLLYGTEEVHDWREMYSDRVIEFLSNPENVKDIELYVANTVLARLEKNIKDQESEK